jgi:hypothetical protein
VHFHKLPSDNWPGIAPAFFFEGIDGPAGLSGAEPDPGERTRCLSERLDEEELADWRAGRNAVYL